MANPIHEAPATFTPSSGEHANTPINITIRKYKNGEYRVVAPYGLKLKLQGGVIRYKNRPDDEGMQVFLDSYNDSPTEYTVRS